MDELEKLFNALTRDGYYTKSFEEFQSQYNDPAYRDKVFGVVSRDGLFTKSREEFDVKYSPSGVVAQETISEDPLKKKEDTVSVSEDGLSESQKPTDFLDFTQMASSPMLQEAQREETMQQQERGVGSTLRPDFAESQKGERFVSIFIPQEDGSEIEEQIDLMHPDGRQRRINIDKYLNFKKGQELTKSRELAEQQAKSATAAKQVVSRDPLTGRPMFDIGDIPLIKPIEQKERKKERKEEQERISKLKRYTDEDKKRYESYNVAANVSLSPLPQEEKKDYLPTNVTTIPKAAEVIEGKAIAVVPFSQEMYTKDKELYTMLYDQEVEDYKDFLKDKSGYIRTEGKYYNPKYFNSSEIFNNKVNNIINSDLIDKEEGYVVKKLRDELSPFGFSFESSGTVTDNIVVTSPDGTSKEFSLDNFYGSPSGIFGSLISDDYTESTKLKAFLKSQYKPEESKEQTADILRRLKSSERRALDREKERIVKTTSQELYESEKEFESLTSEINDVEKRIIEEEKEPDELTEWRGNVKTSIPNQRKIDNLQFLNNKKDALEKKISTAKDTIDAFKKEKGFIPAYVETFAPILNERIEGETEALNKEISRTAYLENLYRGKEDVYLEAQSQAINLAENHFDKEKGWTDEEAMMQYDELVSEMNSNAVALDKYASSISMDKTEQEIKTYELRHNVGRKQLIDAELGEFGDSLVSAFISGTGSVIEGGVEEFGGTIIRNINNMFYDESDEEYITDAEMNEMKKKDSVKKDMVTAFNNWADLTPEAMEAFRESLGVVSKGFYGALESSPAMLLSLLPGGRALAPMGFSFLSAQNLREQMDKNPDFDYMSENDKMKFLAPMAFLIGLLENYGFRNVMRNSSFLGSAAKKLAGKGPSVKTLNELADDLFKGQYKRELGKLVSSGLGEMETEAMQEALDIYGKEYMDLKTKNNFWDQDVRFFKDEKGDVNYFSKKAMGQIVEASLAGFFGGISMKAPSSIASAIKGNKIEEIDDTVFKFYEAGMKSPSVMNAQRAKIKKDVADGKMTQEQATEEWNAYTRAVGQMREVEKVASEYDSSTKKKLLSLLMEKKFLEEKIDGVDKSLTKEDQRNIKVADERIQEALEAGETKLNEDKQAYETAKKDGYQGTFKQHREGKIISKVINEAVEKAAKEKKAPVTEDVVEETTVTEEAPVTEEERAQMREVLGEPAAQEQVVEEAPPVVEEAPVVEQVTEEVVEETPVAEEEELEYGEDTFVYKMSRSRTPSGRGRWESDFEIIDNRDGVSFGKEEGKWVVYNRITNTSVTVDTKKDAQSIIKNAPADGGLFNEGQQVDFSNLTESEQKKFKKQFEAQKIQRKRKKIGESFAKKLAVKEAPVKEAPKRKTRKKKDVSLQQDEIQDKRRTTRRAKRKSDRTRKSSPIDIKGKPRYDVGRSDRVVGDDTVVQGISLSEKEAQDLEKRLGEKAVLDTEFYETNDAKLFHKSITESTKNNKYAASVFVYPVSDYKNSRLFLTADGKAGLAITEDGDIISVFSYGEGKGRVPQLIVTAIKEGAVSLDHYDTVLTKYYADFGFVPAAKVTWNDEFAPAGWSKETFKKFNNGEPDVVAMVYDGGNRETITERVGTFEDVTPKLKEAPYVTEWDDAKKLQDKKKKPKKQEAKISEEVQKEIDRAERLKEKIVVDKENQKTLLRRSELTREQRSERREELEAEIRQTEKRYNNIITELKEGKRTKFQVKETQETKTDASRYQEFVSVLRRSFPSVEVVTTQAEFDTLLKETGANELITKDQSVYGAVYQGKLYLNPSLENYNTPIHEFGHVWMNVAKEANPKLYDKGIGLVKGSEYEQQVKNNPAYKDSTEQEILEEALATAIGDKGEAFVKESKKKSFKDWLSTLYVFVRKLTGISKYTAKQLEDITLDEFTQAVAVDLLSGRQLFEGAEITDMGDALQLQIIGENAELSQQVREDLAFAKAEQEAIDLAEKEGGVEGFKISPDAIKEVTGWERGKDGKWRYEIQDGRLEKVENGTYKLGDIYDAPEFYKAYPDAKNIQVSIDVRKNGRENSWFFPETNSIEINVKNDYRVIQDLVHELQHYIQFKEGFAIGGNEQTFLENPEIVEDLMKKKNQLLIDNEILRAMSFVIELVEVSDDIIDVGLDSLFTKDMGLLEEFVDEQHKENLVSLGLISEDTDFNQMIEDYYFGEAYSGPGEIIGDKTKIRPKTFKGGLTEMQRRKMKIAKRDGGFDEALGELYEISEPIREDLSKLGNHALYERLAGEVEARNATTRLLLSAEKRRKKSLESTEDVAREDQILFMGDQAAAMASMTEKANIKPSMSAQNIIKKARAAEIRDAVIVDYLMSEKDLTRKQAVSAIKRANRGNLKDAVKRLFNSVEDITDIKEKDAQLIKDILKFDRSITRADKIAQKKAKAEIKSRLKAIQRKSKGKLSQAQLLAVTNRFANVNLSSEKSIDSFVDYMQKVFSDVDYAAKMTSLNKSIKQAKKNINSRIGRGADGLAYELRRLLNISPAIIPDSVLEEYSDLVTSFGERKTVLNLKDSAEVKETIAKIFEELSVQNSELGELSERFEAFEDKKFTKTGAVSFAETVAQMLKDKVITEDEAKLMRKFKSEIMPIEKAEGKTEEEKEKELEEEKEILIKNIKKSSVNIDRIELAIEKALVKDFARLIKTDGVNDLNNAQLKNIEKAIDNINNGYVTHYVQLASENLESINRSKTGAEGIRDAKPLAVSTQIAKIKTLYKSGSDANKYYKLIERNPLINIDMVLGDFSSKRIFNSVLEESAEAVTTFNTELNKVYNTIEDAEVQLQKKFKNNGNKILESKYKQMAYMVQQEFESNPNNSQVSPAAEVIEATIKKLRDSNQNYEADILQGILEDYSTDGQIDLKKLDDSFVYAELNMIKTVQDINSKLTDKATYTASVIRGESIEPLNDYIHQSVLNTDGVAVDDSRALSENYMENIKPSTKAKNLIERTKGAKAINFDITASVRRGAKMTLMDYHLTAPLRTANRTLNKMEEQLDNTGQQRQIFLGVRDAYNQAIADVLENTFTSSSIGEQMFQYAAKQGYRSMLASVPRVFGELLSNYSFALINPVEFTEGSKPKNMKVAFSERGVEVMNNVRSKETARIYGEGLSGRFVETSMIEKKMGMAADSAKNPVVNRVNQALSYLKKYPRGVEVVADFMITTPDKLVTRPMWFGTFATEFKKITGEEVNFDKIAENDTAYMEKFEKAINEAKKKADSNSVLIGATDNPLQGILKNKKRASDKASIIKTINSFMQRFLLFEYNAFRKGMYAAMGRGDISPGKGALLMTAVSARMTMYTLMIPILNSLMFGDDDEEKEESIYTRVYRALLSTATNLFIGRDFGAIVKMIQNYFIEYANKEYGEDWGVREGEYDPFKNQVQFNIIPPEKSYKETDIASDILPNMLGPYTPLVKSLIFSGNKLLFSKPKKEDDAKERQRREIKERIPLEILGLTGLVPFYRDFRKSLNEDIYQGLRGSDKEDTKKEKKSTLGSQKYKKRRKKK